MCKIVSKKIYLQKNCRPAMRVHWEANDKLRVSDILHDNNFLYGKSSDADVLAKLKEILVNEETDNLKTEE
jgi:hypothetical protein